MSARWWRQPLDHLRCNAAQPTWEQRYLLDDTYWGKKRALHNGCRGPILFYSGNEGPIEAFYESNGFMRSVLAPSLGGLLVFGEARYYGQSQPQNNSGKFDFLSTEQILADYASLLTGLKLQLNATNCPVVSFGGSYGGTLTTLLRLKYPHVVTGGLASSAPLGYYSPSGWRARGVTPYSWFETVIDVYSQAGCYASLVHAVSAVRRLSGSGPGRAALSARFGLCDAFGDANAFVYWITEALESIPQVNYPDASGGLPAHPVRAVCSLFTHADGRTGADGVSALANVTRWYYGVGSRGCVESARNTQLDGGVPGDGPQNGTAWGYQSCTETLHRFSVPPGAWRSYEWDERRLSDACFAAFGVRPRLDWIEGWSGGYAIADLRTTTNLIWSNGKLDPWHRGGFLRQTDALPGGRVFVFDYTAHHQDLRAPSADDPSELVVARAVEEELIRRWIQEAASATASSF